MVGATAKYVRGIPELTDREKTFLCVTADVCQASLGLAFGAHVRTGLAAGVPTSDIRELLRYVSYDCGYNAVSAGIERIAELEAELGITPAAVEPLAPEQLSTGPDAAPSSLPEPVRARLNELDPHFTGFFDLQSRMRTGHGPGTLSERARGLVSLSVAVH